MGGVRRLLGGADRLGVRDQQLGRDGLLAPQFLSCLALTCLEQVVLGEQQLQPRLGIFPLAPRSTGVGARTCAGAHAPLELPVGLEQAQAHGALLAQ